MKRNIKFNIVGLFAAAVALLTTACQRDPLTDAASDDGEYATVTFSLQPEGLAAATRTGTDETGKPAGNVNYLERHISDGTKANVLIYAVYDEEGNLLPEFGQVERGEPSCTLPDGSELGEGQTCESVETFPVKITLNKVKRNKIYKIAFWAQSSECKAYDVHDLTKVKIHYTEIESTADTNDADTNNSNASTTPASTTPNNDEMRDAFCKVEEIKIDKSANRTIYLYRPLAQINVGTTGYDYETIVQDEKMNYAYTRIQIASAPRYLNVVEDRIEIEKDKKDNFSALEYGWALMPAYVNAEWASENGCEDAIIGDILSGSDISSEELKDTYEWEEFLKVKIYDDSESGEDYMDRDKNGFLKYAGLKDNNKKTETFKYLSMCYVLAASETKVDPQTGEKTYLPSAFDRVRVWIAKDKTGTDEKQIIDIVEVPATRNWRTNIVGNILTTDVPFQVKLDPIYAGDYNGFYSEGEASWSGPLNGLDGGAFYDAETDEILISNAKGLLWLQQMVNGDLKYTIDVNRTYGENAKKGDWIRYYDENHDDNKDYSFGDPKLPYYFRGISDPTEGLEAGTDEYKEAEILKERILIATHQKYNKGYNPSNNLSWPEYKNFHFVGEKDGKLYPANVKLVADIDLSGIEWLSIGFDCKMEQTLEMLGENGTEHKWSQENSNVDKKKHRGFFGHFDGNGHTVSNLTTKRFSIEVHPMSLQVNSGGPYEAVQWYARGFFGQLGGEALVENLTLSNVDIYGFNCVGGIAGAAIGLKGKNSYDGTEINIRNCVVDGGKIESVPMYRGDVAKAGAKNNRTFARGVNTGGIVGLYNASGSVTDCELRNLTISGYRITGGIVGCVANYYLAYTATDFSTSNKVNTSSNVKMKAVTGNKIYNTIVLSDHFKPFDTVKAGSFNESKLPNNTNWAYGFAWQVGYSSFVHRIVGGEFGGDSSAEVSKDYVVEVSDNEFSGCQVIDFACDIELDSNSKILGRIVDINNAPVDLLPVLNNWFVDDVKISSNLVGNATAYKRYKTYTATMYTSTDKQANVMWELPKNYVIDWDKNSGAVGMRVGAVKLNGDDHVLSVRGVTGEKDCAMQISSCDRTQFTKIATSTPPSGWATSAETELKDLTVRGNPYAYTGICLSPNSCMKSITLDGISVYDVYKTLALDDLEPAGESDNVWPKKIEPETVTLTVKNSDLRGYTVPGAGWKSITYNNVIFETGAHVNNDAADPSKKNTCDVDAPTTFTDCTFKAPYTINISSDATATFSGCKVDGPKTSDLNSSTLPAGTKKIKIDPNGDVTFYDGNDSPLGE